MLNRHGPLGERTIEDTEPNWHGTLGEWAIVNAGYNWKRAAIVRVMVDRTHNL